MKSNPYTTGKNKKILNLPLPHTHRALSHTLRGRPRAFLSRPSKLRRTDSRTHSTPPEKLIIVDCFCRFEPPGTLIQVPRPVKSTSGPSIINLGDHPCPVLNIPPTLPHRTNPVALGHCEKDVAPPITRPESSHLSSHSRLKATVNSTQSPVSCTYLLRAHRGLTHVS